MLSPELRTALIDALVDPAKSQTDFAKLSKSREVAYAETAGAITFTTEDMMLGDRHHSRQAFVSQGASE